jgi:hypothetical protein
VTIGPALVLSVIVCLFHVSAYVFIRGRAGARIPLLLLAAILGAWAGDAIASRMAIDPLRVGEFHVITASIVAWLGIGLAAVLAGIIPERPEPAARPSVSTSISRPAPAIEPEERSTTGTPGPELQAPR